MDDTTLRHDDEAVVNERGDEIGMVVEVSAGTAHVDPDPGLTDSIMSKLGWGERDESTYRLDPAKIETVTDEEIRIRT
jgi:hypothetical protein